MNTIRIRDAHDTINNQDTTHEIESGCMAIIADDGRTLFEINLCADGIEIRASDVVRHRDIMLDSSLVVRPLVSNVVKIERDHYK